MENKKYKIIYSDPAWSYQNDNNIKPKSIVGMRHPPYDVMSSKQIMDLPINQIADDNSILFIWTTDYHLEKCISVINAWGFKYKTVGFVWAKKNKQGGQVCFMGAYTMKSGVELCLLATKGKDAHKLVKKHNVRSYIESPRLEHSKKPNEIRNRIIELVGDLPRVELFARQKSEGWDVWGNEVKESIIL